MTALIALAIALVLAPALLGWIVLIRTLLRAYAMRCERDTVGAVRRMNENIVAGQYAKHRTPLERERQLREWVRAHGGAKT